MGGSRAQAGPQLPLSLAQSRDALPCDCDIKEGMPTKPLPWLPAAGRWPARVRPPSTLISSAGRREASSSTAGPSDRFHVTFHLALPLLLGLRGAVSAWW